MTDLEALGRDYRVAFLRYLPGRSETALTLAYEIGRGAMVGGVGVLHLAQVHHAVLAEVLGSAPADEAPHIALAASEFLMEVLASVEMTQRARFDAPGAPADPA